MGDKKKELNVVRLKSGEEILCKVENRQHEIVMHEPLIMVPIGDGQLGFMPYMQYCKTSAGVTIQKDFIVFMLPPSDQLVKEYTTATTGIVVPEPVAGLNSISGETPLKLTEH